MAQEEGTKVPRVFELPNDSISFYSDYARVLGTAEEIILQFYDTIPEAPEEGIVPRARTRLRATITLSYPHAQRIGELLLKRAGEE